MSESCYTQLQNQELTTSQIKQIHLGLQLEREAVKGSCQYPELRRTDIVMQIIVLKSLSVGNTVTVMKLEVREELDSCGFGDLSKEGEMKIKRNRNRQKPDISLAVICTN